MEGPMFPWEKMGLTLCGGNAGMLVGGLHGGVPQPNERCQGTCQKQYHECGVWECSMAVGMRDRWARDSPWDTWGGLGCNGLPQNSNSKKKNIERRETRPGVWSQGDTWILGGWGIGWSGEPIGYARLPP